MQMNSHVPVTRWSAASQAFHWLGAALILVLIGHGWWMTEFAPRPERLANYSAHGSVGYFVLVLTIVRLLWRWMHPGPPLPADAPSWERIAATLSHWGLYLFLLAGSLSGWALAGSARRPLTSTLLGLPVPMITQPDRALHDRLEGLHSVLAWTLAAIIVVHVAGAFYHLWIRKDDVMRRMLP
jgi:cytochrome b561